LLGSEIKFINITVGDFFRFYTRGVSYVNNNDVTKTEENLLEKIAVLDLEIESLLSLLLICPLTSHL